ncbi:hypothetical protein ACJRO7_033757 [Eucalyptus globulus]|uniref:Protease Do-like PDZ domain-containing protein n=1 Tax=Eucalyptus globulus TaxID=34317 RepID=A0ABD3J6H6_EUCGL
METALDSVVKIFTVSSSPDYVLPWQNKPPSEASGSDQAFVQVRKPGSATKYKARVLSAAHECDLAILKVDSQQFWAGMRFLELGGIPLPQDEIAVAGYAEGGDDISTTKGLFSRVEPTQYVPGATQLLAIQIKAAIKPGYSGGPALIGGKVVGVAFQSQTGLFPLFSPGYIVPVPLIECFISGVEESGKYTGVCSLGLSCQPIENSHLRDYFGMRPEMTGVLVSSINLLSGAYRFLKKDDIILEFDGVPVANDGTVTFWHRERIDFDQLASMKKPNEVALIKVLRKERECKFNITLRPLQPLVPVRQFDKRPSYYIFGGLIFTPLTQPYLDEYADWDSMGPRRLWQLALEELPRNAGQEIVIISMVLMDDITEGYGNLAPLQVRKVNEIEIQNLRHLYELVEHCTAPSIRFDLDEERVIVFKYSEAKTATSTILTHYNIPSIASADLIDKKARKTRRKPKARFGAS